jgi:protein-tyrosine-phosphatase
VAELSGSTRPTKHAAVLRTATRPDGSRVRSAASTPADEVNPAVVAAIYQVGIDLSEAAPKRIADEQSARVTPFLVEEGDDDRSDDAADP